MTSRPIEREGKWVLVAALLVAALHVALTALPAGETLRSRGRAATLLALILPAFSAVIGGTQTHRQLSRLALPSGDGGHLRWPTTSPCWPRLGDPDLQAVTLHSVEVLRGCALMRRILAEWDAWVNGEAREGEGGWWGM